ncbi:ankyrin repeat-containing domain protein [Flagelloscypha sp. PMI_526]|nr:ankyrin repeat-containing domain protein [Flagelloscypha sp. PMI_526]
MAEPDQGIRVISFDGPALDATGLSELLILEDIAGRWAWDREGDEREGVDVRVGELCDIVGGTGLGGFYAILFSLGMTIAQVIESHKILQTILFSSEDWKRKSIDACSGVLNQALAHIVEEVDLNITLDAPFLSKNSLKCFVCVLNSLSAGHARALRNYRVRTSKSPRCSIREAIHATLADGVHLPPVCIQDEQFINASSGFTNPSYEVMKELPLVFPKHSKLVCFVNLGAGHPAMLPLTSGGSKEENINLLRYAEVVAQHLEALCSGLGPCYFRLSITKGIEGCDLTSALAIRVVKTVTTGYLEEVEVSNHIDAVVRSLIEQNGVVELERLRSLAAEDGKAKLSAQVEAVHDHVVYLTKVIDHDLYFKIKAWLTPIDQTMKLDSCIRARSPSTCGWFWDHQKVRKWKTTGGIFWCHAGMGTGKTIIASHVIEILKNIPDECFVAYYYFEFTNPSTLSEEALFRSIVSQLSYTSENITRQLYQHHQNGLLQPQLKSLHKALHDLIVMATRPIYIIVEALDELPLPQRRYLLESLLDLSPLASAGAHVMVTSRNEVDIHHSFSEKVSLDVPIGKEMVHRDIISFVDQQLAAKKWDSWPEDIVLEMRNTLIDKADGMFRMVACQVEVLNQTQSTQDMWHALASLPATLGETYLYILNSIPPNLQSRAHTLLCILSVASEPVSVSELAELLAVELGDPADPVNLPVYREGLRYHEPQNIVGLGTALVRQNEHPFKRGVLELSHASVKEFLLQGTCAWYALDDQLAHETTSRAFLALLIHNEYPQHIAEVADIMYTNAHWWKHIPPNHSMQLLSQQVRLFETFPWPHSAIGARLVCKNACLEDINVHSSPLLFAVGTDLERVLATMLESSSQYRVDDLNCALHFAARMGSTTRVFNTLIEKGGDVNSIINDGTPLLHCGACSGLLHVVQLLVSRGANVNAVGGEFGSALQAAAFSGSLDVVEFLVEKGANLSMVGGEHGSPLQAAAYSGALDVVEFFVENGADINMQGGRYGSALQAAAYSGAQDIVEFLVHAGANLSIAGGEYGSVLQAAAHLGNLNVVEFLVESGADVSFVGGEYGSALQAATLSGALYTGILAESEGDYGSLWDAILAWGALDVVEFLVEKGADVNIMGGPYGSALQAAAFQRTIMVVKFLLKEGADVNIAGGYYGSALQAAAYQGALDIIELLVENGADVNMAGGPYGCALQAAVFQGNLMVVELLVNSGADVNMVGGPCGSALQAAVIIGALPIVEFLVDEGADMNMRGLYGTALQAAAINGYLGVVQSLVERGADVNVMEGEYGSALQGAACSGVLRVVTFLVRNGADVNVVGGYYGSALQAAAYHSALDIVDFLVDIGANVNMMEGEYGSALQAAAYSGDLEVVRTLIEKGADVNMQGANYGSALQAAAIQGHLDIVRFLVENGADVNLGGGVYGSVLMAAERCFQLSSSHQRKEEMITFLIKKGAVRLDGTSPFEDNLEGSERYNAES